jgi:hypothetical protein
VGMRRFMWRTPKIASWWWHIHTLPSSGGRFDGEGFRDRVTYVSVYGEGSGIVDRGQTERFLTALNTERIAGRVNELDPEAHAPLVHNIDGTKFLGRIETENERYVVVELFEPRSYSLLKDLNEEAFLNS